MHRSCSHSLRAALQLRALSTAAGSTPTRLNALPKAHGDVKSLKFRRSSPGSAANVLYIYNGVHKAFVDPTHPSLRHANTRQLPYKMPSVNCPAFSLRVMPFGILSAPDNPRPFSRSDDFGVTHRKTRSGQLGAPLIRFSFYCLFTKDSVRSNYIRNRIRTRLKTAASLVATRGASTDKNDNLHVANGPVDPSTVLLKDWSYIFTPSGSLYRMPLEDIISQVRDAMERVLPVARQLEQQWAKGEQKPPYTKPFKKTASYNKPLKPSTR
ncbi:hypothetical protein BKA62DRAFT_685364 [Auriculariales sp. MPI-PUGE-AT-0066]|nr:hypothetical protein BKA62DRAFT_685364 [Auriculariales sp. MPI-PUGE-AT-0066]